MLSKMGPFLALLLLLMTFCSASRIELKNGAPHVRTGDEVGVVVGSVKKSRGGQPYYEFLGLRYATPPDERFMPATLYTGDFEDAEDSDPAKHVHHAVKPGPVCPQLMPPTNYLGNEDCYFLNIHTPQREEVPKGGFPVMVWIHGGAYNFGSGGIYSPEYFMDHDIVVVTFNSRIGALGFLSTGDKVIPGNLGLKDQVLALQYVQENIKFFDGNPKNVTIAGQSSGAASVQYLLVSKQSQGLFHAAIAQSGSLYNLWAFDHKPAEIAHQFGKTVGCDQASSQALLDCLRKKTAQEIVIAQGKMKDWFLDPVVPFAPTLEPEGGKDAFLPEYPHRILDKRRDCFKVPLMTGFTRDEGLSINAVPVLSMANGIFGQQLDTQWNELAPITFNYKSWFDSEDHKDISKELRKFYFEKNKIDMSTFKNLTNIYSDANVVHGVWRFAWEYAKQQEVYPYVFTFLDQDSSQSSTSVFTMNATKYGVSHGDDIQYLFKTPYFPLELPKGSKAETFSKKLVKLWVSFVTHHEPRETWGEGKWGPITKENLQGKKSSMWCKLDEETSLVPSPFLVRKKVWDNIFYKYQSVEKRSPHSHK